MMTFLQAAEVVATNEGTRMGLWATRLEVALVPRHASTAVTQVPMF